jgi:hypothetical protein
LPKAAEDRYYAGEPWSIVLGPKDKKCSLGGHLVYDKKYQLVKCETEGATVITWGKEQLMTRGVGGSLVFFVDGVIIK